jgi:putative hydrolase of the HAD superfamily
MVIQAVLWDVGGVLVRIEDSRPYEELAAELEVTREYLEHLVWGGTQGRLAQLGKLSETELWEYIRDELHLAPGEHPDLRERFLRGNVVDAVLVDFIRTLTPHYKLGVISNAVRGLPALLNTWGILDLFEVVIGSGDEGIMKPDPDIYQLAIERLDVRPGEAVFVDDHPENVEGAQNVGMHGILYQSREQVIRELQSLLNR